MARTLALSSLVALAARARTLAARSLAQVRAITARPLLWARTLALSSLVALAACSSPGDHALTRLEAGLAELEALQSSRDRGELSDIDLVAALDRWQRSTGRELEHLAAEAARSAGPETRAALAARWRSIASRFAAAAP